MISPSLMDWVLLLMMGFLFLIIFLQDMKVKGLETVLGLQLRINESISQDLVKLMKKTDWIESVEVETMTKEEYDKGYWSGPDKVRSPMRYE